MPRLLVKGTEAAMATASGSASTFGNATVVRIVNTASNADTLVTVAESAGGTVVVAVFVMEPGAQTTQAPLPLVLYLPTGHAVCLTALVATYAPALF